MSVAVVDGDNTWAEGYGIASLPSTPATPSTLFYAGSTTKAFTAALMGMLVEDDETYPQVQWDTPVSHVIRDDFVLSDEYATQHITIEDILSHRTGLPTHQPVIGYNLGRDVAVRHIVRQMRHLPLTAQPRTKFQYNNLMYIVASHVIETLTGKWLGDSLAQRIWNPLNMKGTFFSLEDAQRANGQHLAHGYAYAPGNSSSDNKTGYHEVRWMIGDEASGAGAVITNVLDYAKWARCLMRKTAPLSQQVHKAIWEPRTLTLDPDAERLPYTGPVSYALGWFTGVYRGYQFYEHSGGVDAFGAELILFPDLEYSVVLLGNTALTSNVAAKKLAFHLVDEKLGVPKEQRFDWDRYYKDFFDQIKEKAQNPIQHLYPSLPSPTLPATLPLAAYAGTYSHPSYQTVALCFDEPNNVLRADRSFTIFPEQLTFEHVSGEYFVVRSIGDLDYGAIFPRIYVAEFKLGADGQPSELGIGWEEAMKEEKIWFKRVAL